MIHLICALKCEAKPFISHFDLKHCGNSNDFPVYLNQDKNISLTISGVGKTNAANATSYTHQHLQADVQGIWLNIGVAGHKDLAIGETLMAHKIIDGTTQEVWYPPIIFTPPCETRICVSVDEVIEDYSIASAEDSLFEMEASTFYPTACKFSSGEFVHVIKIISDNQEHPTENISAAFVTDLIQGSVPLVDHIISDLSALLIKENRDQTNSRHIEEIIGNRHFTHAQQSILQTCLQRWHVLYPNDDPSNFVSELNNAKEIIEQLTAKLDQADIIFQA